MNNNLKIYCVTNKNLPHLESTKLNLAGVGSEVFSKKYIDSSKKKNIFYKEKYYSELTFHYWYWKNLLEFENAEWVGFCQKRRFWLKKKSSIENINSKNLIENLLEAPEPEWKNFDSILCNPIDVSGAKKIKLIKRGWRNIINEPSLIFDRKKETIKVHFDLHHGHGNLDKAINVMDEDDRYEFNKYVSSNSIYNPHIMFITKPEILKKWFSKLFNWLEKCEEIFGFENLEGYDTTRLYAYLAERYLSFWYRKYTNYKEHPWVFIDQ